MSASAKRMSARALKYQLDGRFMDNYRRGLHSHLGADVKTSLGVCLTVLKH
jgi:hypothetical protein